MMIQKEQRVLDYQLLFEAAPHLYLILDTDLIIIGASDAYLKATMVTRKQIIGQGVFDVFPDNPADPLATGVKNLRESLYKVLKEKIPDTMAIQQYDIRTPSGRYEERYWSPVNLPVFSSLHEINYIIHCVEDVTAFMQLKKSRSKQLKMMEALSTRADEMEVEIYQRAQEIQKVNKQLQNANQNLAKLDQLKTHFFTNLSHELRTPLMLIWGPLSNLLKSSLSPSQINDLKLIESNTRILLKHVKDLLDVAKIEAGKMTINYVHVDLVQLIHQTLDLFQARIDDHQLYFSIETPKELFATIDPEKIQRVLMNLLSNALRFTPDKGHITLTLFEHHSHARIIVKDSGIGIPPHLCEAIFERFFQVEEESTPHSQGTGLGLAISKDFVELHHGTIGASNSPAGGAIFTLDLPIEAPPQAIIHSTRNELPDYERELPTPLPHHFTPEINNDVFEKITRQESSDKPLILVVEDNEDMNQFICTLLSDTYRTESAYDGAEGFQKALTCHPHLIVSDIMMPHVNGIEMVHHLRQHAEFLTTPIIILTAKVDDELCAQMLREGAQDYLIKPFSPNEFKARIANLILAKKAEEELERFVYLASHDLKAPMPAIKNLISWIGEDAGQHLPAESKKHLTLLQRRATRMSNLLDGLLTYFQAGHVDKEFCLVDTNELVADIICECNAMQAFTFHCATDLPIFLTAKKQLRQVFSILIENSIKHHHQDHGQINVSVIDTNNFYTFFITDDGPGIDPVYHHKIFQIFQTLTPRDTLEGNGIGLSIARKIVESHGGKLGLNSEKTEGSTFYFTWPKLQKTEQSQ